jgi:ribosomal protein S18 acetylase RimI-like enzyme
MLPVEHAIPFTFKVASHKDEFEQIYRLNYRVFVEEIPQHSPNSERRLMDGFHVENTYLLCLEETRLVGMVAVRDRRPFSLDRKLPDLDSYLPAPHGLCEIRLLAIEPAFRRRAVFTGLIRYLARYCEQQGYTLAVLSGTVRQRKLYQHLGCVPFGPLVGSPEALYQPMYLTREAFQQSSRLWAQNEIDS